VITLFFKLIPLDRFRISGANMTENQSKKIWIIEPDADIKAFINETLGLRHELKMFSNTVEFKAHAVKADSPSLIITNMNFSEGDLQVLFEGSTERVFETTPFMVVSSNDCEESIRKCYSSGARDYLSQPFGKSELLVKAEQILSSDNLVVSDNDGKIELDPISFKITRMDQTSDKLTLKEFQILSLIHSCPAWKVKRAEIVNALWGNVTNTPKALDVHIFNLRRKMRNIGLQIKYEQPDQYSIVEEQLS
jgi:DNA-binding response OmpR family regulator